MLTDEEKAQLETDFVGKNGQRRKLEVCQTSDDRLPSCIDHRFSVS